MIAATEARGVAALEISEHTATTWDGTELFYRAWRPRRPARRAVVLFHRGHEHSGRLDDVVRGLGLRDTAFFAWDARGHGRSPGARGDAPGFGAVVRDVDAFVRHLVEAEGVRLEETAVLAHSVGAVAAAAWAHDYAPPIRAMVLATPALRVRLYVPFARPALRALRAVAGGRRLFVSSYVKGRMLTHDAEEARRYDEDPLVARAISVDVLLGLDDAARRLVEDAGAIRVPTLVVAGGADWVVDLGVERRFFERLGSPVKRLRVFEGMYHDVLHERDRRLVLDEARLFLAEAFARPAGREPLLDAHERGHTKDEYDRLRRPLAPLAPRRAWYAAERLFLRTAGRLSRGVSLGWETGFDSGRSLDYVYENRARGAGPVGRLVDRVYLDSAGWRGVRERRRNLERLLGEAIERAGAGGRRVHVLDVAAGCGRYVLEAMRAAPGATALLLDRDPANVEAGRRLAERLGVRGATFERGDAFDAAALGRVSPKADVAVVSGLYELFPDNEAVLGSLAGLAAAVRPGGYLVYTGQPWHPQLETIARVLVNRDGEPWVMRRRTQEEIDGLVRAAGFEKVRTEVDDRGIFTVSLARRLPLPGHAGPES